MVHQFIQFSQFVVKNMIYALSSILIYKILQKQLGINSCNKVVYVDEQQYSYCSKQLSLNQNVINRKLSIIQNSANLFINTKYVKETVVKVDIFAINIFSVFGFVEENQIIDSGLINITLSFTVSQAALICISCELSVSNSNLIFIANGQLLSGVLIQMIKPINIVDTSIQNRFSAIQASCIISYVTQSQSNISLVNVVINCYNNIQSEHNGFYIATLNASILISLINVRMCTNYNTTTDVDIGYLQIQGDQIFSCQNVCPIGQYYSYGICVQQLLYGQISSEQTLLCVDPFEFDQNLAQCVCKDGYIQNYTICVNIIASIINLNETLLDNYIATNNNITKLQQFFETALTGNISQLLWCPSQL
ncbi:Hypothetical_protein [Hexamita inflata]|uniref:Hypothetical_protein n=1 Tax=Hexamita inflata TaxID=28002 RepID=A0AA86PW67_9EUKA|nr:Hypothetical protein HINF_LOCUS35029 [Hexamita inflata]CAI9947388.1 Hypothetical protein HINF_LOCUS35033 [Hexamita inflata]